MGVGLRTALTVALAALATYSATVAAQSTEGDVRLIGSDSNSALSGHVQVYHDGAWLPVCLKPWSSRIGNVICRQLGFFNGAVSSYRAQGQSSTAEWLESITCTGDEISLAQCQDTTYGPSSCAPEEQAGLRCAYPMYEGCFSTSDVGVLTDFSTESSSMSITLCLGTCLGRGLTHAGLQQGNKCTCGSAIPLQKQSNSACTAPCSGNTNEICGSDTTVSVYRTAVADSDGTEGGYVTSPGFPSPYSASDTANHVIAIPNEADYAMLVFSHFELEDGDQVMLSPAATTYSGDRDGVPEPWISMAGATSFNVSFSPAAGSQGNTGFALEYKFGKWCPKTTLPSSLADGRLEASKDNYHLGEQVLVDCNAGYQGDRLGVVCQLDGSWSETPVCTLLPTDPPPPSTTTIAPPPTTPKPPTIAPTEASSTTTEEKSAMPSVQPSFPEPYTTAVLPDMPCPVPDVTGGSLESGDREYVNTGEMVILTCKDSYKPANGNTNATCLSNGEFDVGLLCDPESSFPVWLIAIIVVAAVLAIIVIVLVILLLLINNEDKHRRREGQRAPPSYSSEDARQNPREERMVAILPSTHLGHSAANSLVTDSEPEVGVMGEDDSGLVNQGAQTDADPVLGELGEPSVADTGESDAYHPTRDYPGAGRGPPGVALASPPPPPPPVQVSSLGMGPPAALPRQRSADYHVATNDFSMLPSEEMLAVRALDNVVSDFERGDQGYYLGPSGPSPYNMDRAGRYGSRQVQFSQRSRLSNFYGLY